MLSVLLVVEITVLMVAGSVVAWLRFPYRDTDDFHIGCMRYIGPPTAILLIFLTVIILHEWMTGELAAAAPSAILFIAVTAAMIFYLVWAIREIRRPRPPRDARMPRAGRRASDARIVSAHRPRRASVTRRSNSRRNSIHN
jgi:hypothetical protein